MTYKVRFAPSPTGYMHLGNARMAIFNFLLAQQVNADYILRIDDTDDTKVKQDYIDAIKEDLNWLGIKWDITFQQSHRMELYNQFLDKLKIENLVYPCYETKEELLYNKKLQLSMGKPPIYDRKMLFLTHEKEQQYLKEGRKPYYRLKINHENIRWHDLVKGELQFHGMHISDPVVVREDGRFLYLLTSVLDDIEYNISHIIRGEDHVVNTAIQLQIMQYLKHHTLPKFAHLPLITNEKGAGLAKRDGSLSIRQLQQEGFTALAIFNYLTSIGLAEDNQIYDNISQLVQDFNLEKYNSSAVQFDQNKLYKFNLFFIKNMDFNNIAQQARQWLDIDISQEFWQCIKDNIHNFQDIKTWFDICYSNQINLNEQYADKNLAQLLFEYFPDQLTSTTIKDWLEQIKKLSSLKGKQLFIAIRYIISEREDGPELTNLILNIDYDVLKNRIKQVLVT